MPLARDASAQEIAAHDQTTAELAHYKLARIGADDQDGYHRVACPAVMGKLRCPRRPASMTLSHERPTVLSLPEGPPRCCGQQTLTVPASVNAKTAQKYDYPSAAWRASYARRSAVERTFSTIKDPASNDISRGWCRLMGLSAITVFLTCCLVVRNWRGLDAFEAREADDARRAAAGLGLAGASADGAAWPSSPAPAPGPELCSQKHPIGVRGPGRRHGPDVIERSITARLDLVCPVPASQWLPRSRHNRHCQM